MEDVKVWKTLFHKELPSIPSHGVPTDITTTVHRILVLSDSAELIVLYGGNFRSRTPGVVYICLVV